MMPKAALFAFNGELMCFVHVLLNALDMKDRGYEVKVVIEGSATDLIPRMADGESPIAPLFFKVKNMGLIAGACRACSQKMGVLEAVEKQKLELLDDMNGHPGISRYLDEGFEIITF